MKENQKQLSVGIKMGIIHHNIDKYFDRRGKKLGDAALPKSQGMTMHYIMDHRDEDVFQKDIEKHFNITGATATNILKALEADGFILRVPTERDARMKKIVLTEKAIKRQNHIKENVTMLDSTMISGFTPEEMEKFHEYLDRVILNIDSLLQDNE